MRVIEYDKKLKAGFILEESRHLNNTILLNILMALRVFIGE